MILNHKDAIAFLVSAADEIGFNRHTVLNLHGILAQNLLPDPAAAARLRRIAVGIEKSAFHPLEVPQLIEECFNQLLTTAAAIGDPFEQSFFVMVHLPYLQPFGIAFHWDRQKFSLTSTEWTERMRGTSSWALPTGQPSFANASFATDTSDNEPSHDNREIGCRSCEYTTHAQLDQ